MIYTIYNLKFFKDNISIENLKNRDIIICFNSGYIFKYYKKDNRFQKIKKETLLKQKSIEKILKLKKSEELCPDCKGHSIFVNKICSCCNNKGKLNWIDFLKGGEKNETDFFDFQFNDIINKMALELSNQIDKDIIKSFNCYGVL